MEDFQGDVETHEGDHSFYHQKYKIYKHSKMAFPQGQYELPFQLQLDEDLIGSYHEKCQDFQAFIRYHVEASIKTVQPGAKAASFKQEIGVRGFTKEMVENVRYDASAKIVSCCCFDRGSIQLVCKMKKSSYDIHTETPVIQVEVDNSRCKNHLKSLEVTLFKLIKL